jgi:hypothetical protein
MTNGAYTAEIYRQDGAQFRTVGLSARAHGSVCPSVQEDMGKLAKEMLGDDDCELCVDVPATRLRKLTFAVVREDTPAAAALAMNPAYSAKGKWSNTNGAIGYGRPELIVARSPMAVAARGEPSPIPDGLGGAHVRVAIFRDDR